MYADSLSGLTLQWNKAIVNAVRCTCAFLALTTPNVSVEKKVEKGLFLALWFKTPHNVMTGNGKGEKKSILHSTDLSTKPNLDELPENMSGGCDLEHAFHHFFVLTAHGNTVHPRSCSRHTNTCTYLGFRSGCVHGHLVCVSTIFSPFLFKKKPLS